MDNAGRSWTQIVRAEGWAPDDVFPLILKYSVIPTFDLILKGSAGVLLVRRRISPYRQRWALPGLRILKGESIHACLSRIALLEVGVRIDPARGVYIGQAVASFRTRQDLSTCYAFDIPIDEVRLNCEHFSGWRYVKGIPDMPRASGGLYRRHLSQYFAHVNDEVDRLCNAARRQQR